MRAARFYGPQDIRLDHIPAPTPQENEVLIEVEWGGICGSDLHEYVVGPLVIPQFKNPHSLTGEHLPITLCHEFCGRVSADAPTAGLKGANGVELKAGMAVMIDPRLNCRSCNACRREWTHLCPQWGFRGLSGGGGGFGELCAVRADMCYPLPEDVDLRNAALIEPLAVGRHALTVSGVEEWKGVSILVLGGGPVGLALLFNLKAVGAEKVFLSEPTAKRQEQCRDLATRVLNPTQVKVAEECRKETGGEGVDIVFDCAGIARAMQDGMDALRRRGTYVNVAGWEGPFELPMQFFMFKEITVKTSMAYDDRDFAETVKDFVAGKFAGVEKMVTARIALEDVKDKGFEQLVKHKDEHVKILASPKKERLGAS